MTQSELYLANEGLSIRFIVLVFTVSENFSLKIHFTYYIKCEIFTYETGLFTCNAKSVSIDSKNWLASQNLESRLFSLSKYTGISIIAYN